MKMIDSFMKSINEEIDGAMDYADKYVELKAEKPKWASAYHDMAANELTHAEHLLTMAKEHVSALGWISEETKDNWSKCQSKAAEKTAMIKMMLNS